MRSRKEKLKRLIKNCIPWRLRYFIKLQETKGNITLPKGIKQFREIDEYNNALYNAISDLKISDFNGKSVCELGPGQHLSHAFLEYQLGADREILLEIGDFAGVDDPVRLKELQLTSSIEQKRKLPKLSSGETWGSYLKKINAVYSTNGLDGYKAVPDDSIDYCFSFAVFEHIRKKSFIDTMKEVYRMTRRGGIGYHIVDFKDHMGGKKNQLRFSESVWEDEDHYKMDNYTNRISCSEMCDILKTIGFSEIKVKRIQQFGRMPIKRSQISRDLGHISDEDIKTAMVVLKVIK